VLHKTQQDADKALRFINELGCGGGCRKWHKIIDLDH
jgi:hypothetical protein